VAAYIETPSAFRVPEADRRRVEQNLRLAEQLGAQAITIQGQSVADEATAYARAHNVTKIVIGKPERPRWREILFGSVVDDLVRRSGEIDVYVIRGEADEAELPPAPRPRQFQWDWKGTIAGILSVAVVTLLGWPMYHHLHFDHVNVLMMYLLGVLWVASRHSRAAAAVASLLAVAAFDFFFVPPYLSFAVTD